MLPTTDDCVTSGLTEAVEWLLPELEQLLQPEDQDLAARDYPLWRDALDEPLPQQGAGAEATLQILRDEVIPHGSRMGAPGFVGWVTTAPTIVPVAAALSASLAGPQRYDVQSYNFLEHLALQWLKQLLGLPSALDGVFSSGGSVANLIALGTWAPGVIGAAIMAWLVSYAWRRLIVNPDPPLRPRSGETRPGTELVQAS
jgi:hypothetical protein